MQIGVATARDRKVTYIYANERKREKEKLPFAVCSTPKDERCIRLNTTDLTTSLFYKKRKKSASRKEKTNPITPLPPHSYHSTPHPPTRSTYMPEHGCALRAYVGSRQTGVSINGEP